MSPPAKWMRPPPGAISPASCPISVVLPAPLGPMMACNSPFGTASEMASQATTPPKRLVNPSISRRASLTARRLEHAVDPAAREQHDQEKHRTKDDLPVFRRLGRGGAADQRREADANDYRQRLLKREQGDRAKQWTEHRAHAAEHRHHHEITRARPVHDRGTDEVGVVGKERAGKAADRAGDDEAGELVTIGRETDGAHAALVRARTLNNHAEARVHHAPDQIDGRYQ